MTLVRRARDIPASIINLRIAVAVSLGASQDKLLEEIQIDPSFLANPMARVSVEQAMDTWKAIINQTGNHNIGLECGLKARYQMMGILGYVMMNSNSILNAWKKLCTYQELVLSIVLQKILIEGDRVTFAGTMQEKWQNEFRFTIDYIYASSLALIKNSTPKEIYPLEVGFNYPKPEDVSRYYEIFNTEKIKFSCKNPYITFKKSDLENEITGTDSNMYDHFEGLLEDVARVHDKVDYQSRAVRNSILRRMKAEIPRIEDVSRELAMSVRSLQERLKKEGTSYQIILNNIRKDMAMKQLSRPDFTVTDVAFMTGFSDISVFSRNFKKWTGYTPTEFQKQN